MPDIAQPAWNPWSGQPATRSDPSTASLLQALLARYASSSTPIRRPAAVPPTPAGPFPSSASGPDAVQQGLGYLKQGIGVAGKGVNLYDKLFPAQSVATSAPTYTSMLATEGTLAGLGGTAAAAYPAIASLGSIASLAGGLAGVVIPSVLAIYNSMQAKPKSLVDNQTYGNTMSILRGGYANALQGARDPESFMRVLNQLSYDPARPGAGALGMPSYLVNAGQRIPTAGLPVDRVAALWNQGYRFSLEPPEWWFQTDLGPRYRQSISTLASGLLNQQADTLARAYGANDVATRAQLAQQADAARVAAATPYAVLPHSQERGDMPWDLVPLPGVERFQPNYFLPQTSGGAEPGH